MAAIWRTSPVLLCVVAIAVAVGAAANLVASARPPVGVAATTAPSYSLPAWVWGVLLLSPFAAVTAALVHQRLTGGAFKFPGFAVAFALAILGVLVLFAILGSSLPAGGLNLGSGSTHNPGGNSTGGGNQSGGGGGGSGPLGLPPVSSFHLPVGTYLVAAIVAALAIAGLAIPSAWGAFSRRRDRAGGNAPPVEAVRSALEHAAAGITAGSSPRAVIERLYADLLVRVVQVAGDVSGRTPEEIRSDLLLPLGVRPPAATALTRLFEEARYSTHPMGSEAADRVRSAVGAAAADLMRVASAR